MTTGDRPRRITFLIPSLEAGGAERQLVGLANGLHRAGWRVRVVTFYDGGAFGDDLVGRGVTVESLHKGGRLDLPAFFVRLVRSLRRERPDMLHSYLVAPNIVSVFVRPFVRGIRIVWGVRASDMNLERYGRLPSLVFAVSCRLARFADLIICNSDAGLAFHASRGYPRDRMVSIPNGIDTAAFAADPAARDSLRSEWDVDPDTSLVGLVGRLDPMKDHPTFLRAAARVGVDRPDVHFVCVGHGSTEAQAALAALAAELGIAARLTWAGGRRDLPAVFNALDLAVSSSAWGEGFPNVVAEAMSTGRACVVTDVGDSARLVADTGWVCRPGDPDGLATAIEAALSSPDELRLRGERARQRIAAEFSEEHRDASTAERLVRLLERGSAAA